MASLSPDSAAIRALAALDTFPKLLLDHAARRSDKPANREKDYGIWQSWSWRQVADEMAFVLDHAEVRFAIAEDQEQVDKLLAVKDRIPGLETIIYSDGRGMRHYAQPFLHAYADIQAKGREFAAAQPDFLAGEIAKGKGADLAII